MPGRYASAKRNKAIAAAFPEVQENLARIERVQVALREQLERAAAPLPLPIGRGPPYTAPSLLDPGLRTCALARDAVENRMDEFGGRGHQGTVAGLMGLHVSETMPYPQGLMPSHRESRIVAEITAQDGARSRQLEASPLTKPAADPKGRKMKQRQGRKDTSRTGLSTYNKSRIPHDYESPLTIDERDFLGGAPWLAAHTKLDAHDRAVISGLPYRAHRIKDNEHSIKVLGQVLNKQKDPKVLLSAICAFGDKGNLGKNTCLAHLVPQLKSLHPELRAAALTSIAQVSLPGQERQYCEVELTIWGATNLPKKDRFGACDAYVKTSLVTPHGTYEGSTAKAHQEQKEEEEGSGGGGRGYVRERRQSRIIWRDLNPFWKETNNYHILDPDKEVFEFTVWDEDGERDDIVGTASLPLYMVPFDLDTGEMPTAWHSLGLVDPDGEAVRGYDNMSLLNDGKLTKLNIKARYVSFLRPSDLMDGLLGQLEDDHQLPRIAAAKALKSLAPPDGNEALLAAIKMIGDDSLHVQNQALRDLNWCARGNEEEAVSLLCAVLDKGNRRERLLVLQGLSAVCDGGEGRGEYTIVVRALAARLESDREEVRCAVVDGLAMVAKKGDPLAVDQVCARFDHPRGDTRECAALALSKVGNPGDAVALGLVAPLLEDPSAAVRHAAVLAVFALGDVGANTAPAMERIRQEAFRHLKNRVDGNQGRGDLDGRVRESAGRLADKLDRPGMAYYRVTATKEGAYSPVLPAAWVQAGRGLGHAARSIPVETMPKDTKFHAVLPYRPPSPLWDPRAQEKKRLKTLRENYETEILVATRKLAELRKSETMGELEMSEMDKLKHSIEIFKELDAKTAEEYLQVAGPIEVQPDNTTKLGFTIDLVLSHGDHCQNIACSRSKYY